MGGREPAQRVEKQRDVGVAQLPCAVQPHLVGRPGGEGRDAVDQDARADHHVQIVDGAPHCREVTGADYDPSWEIASVLEHSPASFDDRRVVIRETRLRPAVAQYT